MNRLRGSGAIPGRQRGIALLSVLWALALLSTLAGGLVAEARTDARIARNAVEAARARALAEAGVARAILALATSIQSGMISRPDGSPAIYAFADGEVQVSVRDEGGKIDLNLAPREALQGLFLSLGIDRASSESLTDAILDWRDGDTLRRPAGAEDEDYRRAGVASGAKDASFIAVEELARVLGMAPEVYARLEPLVTVHSRMIRVNPDTAPPEVLAAVAGTASAGPATASYTIKTLSVTALAHTDQGGRYGIEAIVDFTGTASDPFHVHAWRQVSPGATASR
ncbi:hypothetical protein [Arenibaculum sp.]|uniref:general secretion pathway protein GspK n=1 Tax=Arenibaculum sp. TaxID=2865862 RepID=UPI002E12CDBF|nr:hypothetical protein [Arenibaculum sp.]